MECVYAEVNDPRPGGGHDEYSIFVVDRSGHGEEIKEWPATPNKLMRPSGMTPLRLSQIADLEIRQSDTNEVLLRAPVSITPVCPEPAPVRTQSTRRSVVCR